MIKTAAIALTGVCILFTLPTCAVAVDLIEIIEKKTVENDVRQHGFNIEHFEQWVFRNQQTLTGARRQLLDRLQAEIDSVHATCHLSDDQREKLLLAGRGDIEEFIQQFANVRAEFNKKIAANDQQGIQNMWQEAHLLHQMYQGKMHGDGSLFRKVLNHLLDEQQLLHMKQLQREQVHFRYQAAVMQLISQFDRMAPTTQEKREKLLALIDQYTFPPKSITGDNQSRYLLYYVLGQMQHIPKDELRPLFGKSSWPVLQKQMKLRKSIKRSLEKRGLVPEKE